MAVVKALKNEKRGCRKACSCAVTLSRQTGEMSQEGRDGGCPLLVRCFVRQGRMWCRQNVEYDAKSTLKCSSLSEGERSIARSSGEEQLTSVQQLDADNPESSQNGVQEPEERIARAAASQIPSQGSGRLVS